MTRPPSPARQRAIPTRLLDRTLDAWGERGDVWIFGYASLIWRPEFDAAEDRPATVLRLAPRAGDALARQPRHAGVPGPGVRAGPGRLVPRPRLPDRAGARRGRAAAPLGAARCRPASTTRSGSPAARRRAPCARLAFTLSRRSPSHTGALARRADGRDPAHRQRPLRQHARLPGRDGARRCAPAASATATSSAWSPSRGATRSPAAERPRSARPRERRRRRRLGEPRARRRGRLRCRCRPGCRDRRRSTRERRIAGDQAARAFVAAQRRRARNRARRRSRPDGRAGRGAGRRRPAWWSSARATASKRRRLHQRHVAGQDQPAGGVAATRRRRRRSSAPMPSGAPASLPTSGRTTTSRAATLLRATVDEAPRS